jgi:hypothetical protein
MKAKIIVVFGACFHPGGVGTEIFVESGTVFSKCQVHSLCISTSQHVLVQKTRVRAGNAPGRLEDVNMYDETAGRHASKHVS